MHKLPDLELVARSLARHRRLLEAFTQPATDLIVKELRGARAVLDLAAGTGDPALALAAALPDASVIATDCVPELLQEARAEARVRQLSNVSTLQADMHALPLATASVSAVSSRFGLQFARDVGRALAEARRVLEPGGVTCHVAWGAADQPLLRAMLGAGAPFVVGVPGPFQFSRPGALAQQLRAAGLVDVEERTHVSDWAWNGDAHSFWHFMHETSGDELAADADQVIASLNAYEQNEMLVFPVEVHCARARKPLGADTSC